jgi:hypothetical protein
MRKIILYIVGATMLFGMYTHVNGVVWGEDPVCSPACKYNETCGAENKCAVNPACPGFVKASVSPSTVRPFDQVTVKCNYGKRLDCLKVTGAGLSNCRYSRFEGTDNVFACDASLNAGFFDDAKCVTTAGTADKCCTGSEKAGDITVLGTEVHYDQDMVLPFGTYTLSARVFSVIAKGKGNRVVVICNSDTCTSTVNKNGELGSISFAQGTDFETKSLNIPIAGTGDDKHYLVRVSVDKGSEGYFDSVSLKDANRDYVQNGDFAQATDITVATRQPVSWGEGDNKVGYYYGSLAAAEDVVQPLLVKAKGGGADGGPTAVPGEPTTVALALKIKLQGVSKKPAKADPINVQVKLAGGSLTAATEYKTISFTVNDAGEWSGKASFDKIPTGSGYRVYIKGPKHISKKVCDAAPTEATPGSYHCGDGKITLQAGDNTLDFSKIIQLGGDLSEAGGKQNGIIDAYDTTFVRTNLGTSDASKIAIGDINFDGGIDTLDYSMVLQSLSIKYDEE